MKFFAVALVRATLPVLRHRHAKVRLVAVRCLAACMVVPDKAKIKGSGTDAIVRNPSGTPSTPHSILYHACIVLYCNQYPHPF